MSEEKKLKEDLIDYLSKKGHDKVILAELVTLTLLRMASIDHADAVLEKRIAVTYHTVEEFLDY